MPPPAAEFAAQGPPLGAMIVSGVLCLLLLMPMTVIRIATRKARRLLCLCPCCGAHAVRDLCWENLSVADTRVAVQCGQCETWRRVVVEDSERRAQEHRMERDRVRMGRTLRQLEHDRRPRSTFTARRTANGHRRVP